MKDCSVKSEKATSLWLVNTRSDQHWAKTVFVGCDNSLQRGKTRQASVRYFVSAWYEI